MKKKITKVGRLAVGVVYAIASLPFVVLYAVSGAVFQSLDKEMEEL